jgi:hypothetical protein
MQIDAKNTLVRLSCGKSFVKDENPLKPRYLMHRTSAAEGGFSYRKRRLNFIQSLSKRQLPPLSRIELVHHGGTEDTERFLEKSITYLRG